MALRLVFQELCFSMVCTKKSSPSCVFAADFSVVFARTMLVADCVTAAV